MQGVRVRPTIPAPVKNILGLFDEHILGIDMGCERRSLIKLFLALAGNIYAILMRKKKRKPTARRALSLIWA